MGLFKRDKVWWMSFSFRGEQVRKSTEVTDKRLAEKIHAKVLTQIAEGKWFEKQIGAEKTFREMMERFDREHFSTLPSSTTCRCYFMGLMDFFGDYTLAEITSRLIHEFKLKRRAEGVGPDTINRQLTIAKSAYNMAIRQWEWCKDNPFAKVPSEKGGVKRDRWLTYEVEEKLLSVSPKWLSDFIVGGSWTGMREGNIINLKRSQVDLIKRVIYLGGIGNHRTKNKEPQVIPMNQKVFDLLKEKMKVRHLEHDLVFTSPTGRKIDPQNLRREFKKALSKAGIEDFKPHDLRHTYGTRLAQAGVDLYTISKLLGHKDIRTTQRYAHHCTQSLRRGIDILEKEFITILSQSGGNDATADSGESVTA